MPRPSLRDQRSAEILDAYLTCVARFGLDGATQERIATEAGMKRPLLRHYLGNRSEMIAALTQHVVDSFAATTEALEEAVGPEGSPDNLIDLLFDERNQTDPRLMLAYQALVAAISEFPDMRQPLLDSFSRFLAVIEAVLRRSAPRADPTKIRAVAQGIAAPYVNLDALAPLEPPAAWRAEMKLAAHLLAATLETLK